MITVSKKVEYSVDFLSFLSKNKGKNVSLAEVSRKMHLPYRFLSQLATDLKKSGLVRSQEGRGGGYQLSKDWDKKTLYDLVEALGENKALVACLGEGGCQRTGKCQQRFFWQKVGNLWQQELKKIKLKEI